MINDKINYFNSWIRRKLGRGALRWKMWSKPELYVRKDYIIGYQRDVLRRSLLSFQEIDELSLSIPFKRVISTDTQEPLYYGAFQELCSYAGIYSITMPPKMLGIQHGYVFEIRNFEKSKFKLRNLVWSKKLVEMYHEYTTNPDIYAIGAPFFYARNFYDEEELKLEKKRLGKNLLAFPMHSQMDVNTNYNPRKFLGILSEERKRFDTIRVCMYWKDIQRGAHKVFEEAGYECVCNGHLLDPNFLRRQKSLFELADATISNGVGSHIGYSIFMGKPHWLIDDEYEYVNTLKTGDAFDLTSVTKTNNFHSVKNAFLNNQDYKITSEQKDVVDKFWGVSDMKSPEILKQLIVKLYDL